MRGILCGHEETAEGNQTLCTGKQNSHLLNHGWPTRHEGDLNVSSVNSGGRREGASCSPHQSSSCRGAGVGVAGLYRQTPGQVGKSPDV